MKKISTFFKLTKPLSVYFENSTKTFLITLLTLFGVSSSFGQIVTETFTTTGSFTVPCGITSISVKAWGGGGGGGGSTSSGNGGSGGGSGAYSEGTLTVTAGQTISFIVGLGGNGGTNNNNISGNGGNAASTTFSTITANGGQGGLRNAGTRGAGGTVTGAFPNLPGNNGTTGGNSGGNGGNAPNGGNGGAGQSNNNGIAGTPPGGGGGGGERGPGTNYGGGRGGDGQIEISYTNFLPANPSNPTSNSPQCNPPGVTLTRVGTPPPGVTWYWQTIPMGITIANSSATNLVSTSGTYYLRARNDATGCWSAGEGSITVVVNQPPGAIVGAATVCSGKTTTYTNTVAGGTWSVINDPGTNASIIPGTGVLSGGATAGTATVVYTIGSCTPATYPITVNLSPAVTNSPTSSICSGTGPNITLTSNIPSTYTWTIGTNPSGITGALAGSGGIINQTLINPSSTTAASIQYLITPTAISGGCVGAVFTITVTVNPKPVGTNPATASICSGTSPAISLAASVPSTFAWSVGTITGGITGASAGSGGTINQILTNPSNTVAGSVEYLVTPTSTTGSCIGNPYTITVTVRPKPAVTNAGTASICSGTSPAIALLASTPSTFAWTIGTITGGITGAGNGSGSTINQVLTNPNNATAGTVQYLVTPTATSGSCVGTQFIITVTVNPKPAIGGGAATVCVGSASPAFTSTIAGGNWTITNGTGTASINISTGIVTGGTAGSVTIIYTLPATGCSATIPMTVTTVPATVTTPNPANNATAICYVGTGSISAISWGAVSGATSYDVFFGSGTIPVTVTSNVLINTYNTGALAANTTYIWRIVAKNSCGDALSSATWSFTTSGLPCVCSPTSWKPNGLYISSVAFVGTLADPPVNTSTFNATGFQNFVTLPSKALQAQGEGVNIVSRSTGNNYVRGTWKAWVDWNKDGIFDQNPLTEEVYNIQGYAGADATFGFVIPAAVTPGDYRIRIRVNNGTDYFYGIETFGFDFSPCDPFEEYAPYDFWIADFGETEDYLFTVVAKCNSTITAVTNGQNCGTGTVALQATATPGVTEFRWYTTESGGSYTTSTPVGTSTTFTTSSISATTNYYVTAWNGTCESQVRTLVIAKINPTPIVTFITTVPTICGDGAILQLTAVGDKEVVYLVNENFEGGALGVFSNINNDTNNAIVDVITSWKNHLSTFVPDTNVWFPAISSGFGANRFALAYSDSKKPNYATTTVENSIALTSEVSSATFLTLQLKLRLFYSRYFPDGFIDPVANEFVNIELSTDGGATYPVLLQSFTSDVGIGTKFVDLSYDLLAYINQPHLKIRVRHRSFAGNGWLPDGVAIDNVELFGERPLVTSFQYNTAGIDAYTDIACTPPYAYVSGTPITTIFIKPSANQLEDNATFTVPVNATLSNGCSANGSVVITNNTKIWNSPATDWSTNNWKPMVSGLGTVPPFSDNCVIVKTPVTLGTGYSGLARNLAVEGTTGNLTIAGNLQVTDFVKNTTGSAANLTLKSGANLIQINPSNLINVGSITAERNVTNMDYNPGTAVDYVYWSAPVLGQQTKGPGGFSPGTPNNRFYDYRESNDRFYETPNLTFVLGKGYAVQAESTSGLGSPYTKDYIFRGPPNNGDVNIALTKSPDNPVGVVHGYNLIGNPYPSNISFNELYLGNSALIYNSAWFWTNVSYQQYQMGSGYLGNNYAVINGTGGVPYVANGMVSVGQGFIVQAKSSGMLSFKNSYSIGHDLRVSNSATFFQKEGNARNRFWLNLVAPSQIINSQLIAYVAGATDGYEQDYDAEAFDNYSDLFYSILPGKKLMIQGKSESFTTEDKVTLGANFFQNGTYTIALAQTEGIFEGSQNIYLKDKQQGVVTNLSQGSYTFTATSGDNATRFEIIYKPETVLATGDGVKDDLVVYRNGNDFVVKSQSKKIDAIELYDTAGRLIYTAHPKNKEALIPAEELINSTYVLKISRNGEISTKKILR